MTEFTLLLFLLLLVLIIIIVLIHLFIIDKNIYEKYNIKNMGININMNNHYYQKWL